LNAEELVLLDEIPVEEPVDLEDQGVNGANLVAFHRGDLSYWLIDGRLG
jgi:hypothetical protein